MAAEDWPKGVKVCRCMDPGEPDGSIRPYGRVLEVFRLGEVGPVVTPAWCRRTDRSFDSGSKLGMSHAPRASECSTQDDREEG